MKELMNLLGSMGPRKYPSIFLRNCCFRALASGAGPELYWL